MVRQLGWCVQGGAGLLGAGAARQLGSPKQASWLGSCRPSQGAPTERPQAHEGPWARQPSCNVPDPSTSPALWPPSPRPDPNRLPPLLPCSTTQDHPASSHSPWVKPGQGQGCPGWQRGPLGARGPWVTQVCPGALWAFTSNQQASHRSWLSQEHPLTGRPRLARDLSLSNTCPSSRVLSTPGTHGPHLAPPASLSPGPLGSFSRPVGALRTDSAGRQLPWQGRSPTSVPGPSETHPVLTRLRPSISRWGAPDPRETQTPSLTHWSSPEYTHQTLPGIAVCETSLGVQEMRESRTPPSPPQPHPQHGPGRGRLRAGHQRSQEGHQLQGAAGGQGRWRG